MKLIDGQLYHVFNRGNNRQVIFPRPENYAFFLGKIKKYIVPNCEILAWCLMPNHFHFLVLANSVSVCREEKSKLPMQKFSYAIQQLLSSYTKAINKQEQKVGSLFQQNTKAVQVSEQKKEYSITVFHYIHQNPMSAKLVGKMEDWPYSSFNDYCNQEFHGFCNIRIAEEILGITKGRFYEDSYQFMIHQPEKISLDIEQ